MHWHDAYRKRPTTPKQPSETVMKPNVDFKYTIPATNDGSIILTPDINRRVDFNDTAPLINWHVDFIGVVPAKHILLVTNLVL